MKIKCTNTNEVAHSYVEYLTTQHWRDLRIEAFHKADGKCTVCKRYLTNNFICHHVSTSAYHRIGRERINQELPYLNKKLLGFLRIKKTHWKDDIIAVCRWCHNGTSENHIKLHKHINVPQWARIQSRDIMTKE